MSFGTIVFNKGPTFPTNMFPIPETKVYKSENRFVNLGYRDWKHAGGKGGAFAKHNSCKQWQI